MTQPTGFRAQLLARQTLIGTFLKTPTGHGVEIIGDAGFDFVVIDQEHAPFDRSSTDVALAIACARGLPALVRVAGPETVLSVLDGGATGILMPHVASVEQARAVVSACRYRGGRGGARRPPPPGWGAGRRPLPSPPPPPAGPRPAPSWHPAAIAARAVSPP